MKTFICKLILFVALFLATVTTLEAQRIFANEARIRNRLILDDYEIIQFENGDVLSASTNSVPTSYTVATAMDDAIATALGGISNDTLTANGELLPGASTTSNISAGATFTSPGYDATGVATINVSSLTTGKGTLYIDMGPDSSNWDLTFEYKNYSKNAKTEYHTHAMETPRYKYFRIRFTNTSGAPYGFFRLQTTVHYTKPPLDSKPANAVVWGDYQSQLTRTVNDYRDDINLGRVGNAQLIQLFGSNNAVGNGAYEVIWSASTTRTFTTNAETFRIRSGGNANDVAGGSGAQSVIIEYLDNNWETKYDTIATAGAAASASTSNTARRFIRAWVHEAGTYGGANTGTITFEGTATANLLSTIQAGNGETQLAIYSVPAGYTAYITQVTMQVGQNNSANIRLYFRNNADDITGPTYGPRRIWYAHDDMTGAFVDEFEAYKTFPEKTDIWAEAIRNTGAGNAAVTVEFDILLIRNQ